MSASLQSSDVRFWSRAGASGRGGSRPDPLLVPERDLGIGQAGGVPLALLRGDVREDAIEVLVLDDDAGDEPRLVPRMQPIGERVAVAVDGDRAVRRLAD